MTNYHIYENFDRSIIWNAYLYIIEKFLSVFLTTLFFKHLTTLDFSIWANLNSIIFLLILWADFGFRKSIPYFMPEFAQNKNSHIKFTRFIFAFQLLTMNIIFIPVFFGYHSIINFLGIAIPTNILLLGILLFFLEGFVLLFQVIYHSHFWNKQFNLYFSIFFIAEVIINFIFLFYIGKPENKLANILLVKIVINFLILVWAVLMLKVLYKKNKYDSSKKIDYTKERNSFLKHSFFMWINTFMRSVTERNYLIPMLTHAISPTIANIFKISNDWATLFQRAILKSIGTSDTTLFSQARTPDNKNMKDTFRKIFQKILQLCLPLLLVFIFLVFNKEYFMGKDEIIFQTFLVLVSLYIIEAILSPYERILEVNRNYYILIFSYIPLVIFSYIFTFKKISFISLGMFLFLLCFVRLLSCLIITFYAKKKYEIKLLTLLKRKSHEEIHDNAGNENI